LTVRKVFQTIGNARMGSIILLLCFHLPALWCIIIMGMYGFLGAFAVAGSNINNMDIAPQYVGVLFGITNTAANLPGIFGVASAGFIIHHTKSWALVWIICSATYGFSVVVWLIWAKAHPLFVQQR